MPSGFIYTLATGMKPAILFYVQLETRTCSCGCGKTFRCLPTSQTRYSSRHCMEAAGVIPPSDKPGYGANKASKPAGATVEDESEAEAELDDSDAPLLLEEEDDLEGSTHEDEGTKGPPEVDPIA